MKKLLFYLSISVMLFSCKKQESMQELIARSFKVAQAQTMAMANELKDKEGLMPRSLNPETGELVTSDTKWWCSGFFPGVLWYVFEYTKDDSVRVMAEKFTARVEPEKFNSYDHDIGFQIYCSFGNGLRLTNCNDYVDVLKTAGQSALKRYNPTVGLLKSWDSNPQIWQYPVIIDNMMNLELLMWNYKNTNDTTFLRVAKSHADKTLKNQFRSDNSVYHLVSYDTITGEPHLKQTVQGAFDESLWARGHAWGLYGYTMMFRETTDRNYLEQAVKIAEVMIHHPNMPEDMVPYWDYSYEEIPNTSRDASSAAIMASALIELAGYIDDIQLKDEYLKVAEKQLRTLSSPEYMAEPGTNAHFILKNNVGHFLRNSEVDVPLTYADYYFLEALLRYKKVLGY
jgi:unsaturated chondroitin disaccharide hydrolase